MSIELSWAKRTKWLTQALILSGTLNIALLATFAYISLKEKENSLFLEQPRIAQRSAPPTNIDLLRVYSVLPYQELILKLENQELVEEGLSKRDLALACLCAFHHFNIDKALGGLPLHKREVSFTNTASQETLAIPVFPGLSDAHFLAILQYAKTEKWPLTSQGIFYEIKRSQGAKDPSLLIAFQLTPEYQSVYTLLTKSGNPLTKQEILALIEESDWQLISQLHQTQRITLELTPEKEREFLLNHVAIGSKQAAHLLITHDLEAVMKRLSDGQMLQILNLGLPFTPALEQLAKELLLSPRTEAVWKKAASILYANVGESFQEPYDHLTVLQRFCPEKVIVHHSTAPLTQMPLSIKAEMSKKPSTQKRVHTVEPGENLWKIARKYQVSIDDIMKINRLESEKLRPGRSLEIPEKKPSAR